MAYFVQNEQWQPLQGAVMEAVDAAGAVIATATSDKAGWVEFGDIGSQGYTVRPRQNRNGTGKVHVTPSLSRMMEPTDVQLEHAKQNPPTAQPDATPNRSSTEPDAQNVGDTPTPLVGGAGAGGEFSGYRDVGGDFTLSGGSTVSGGLAFVNVNLGGWRRTILIPPGGEGSVHVNIPDTGDEPEYEEPDFNGWCGEFTPFDGDTYTMPCFALYAWDGASTSGSNVLDIIDPADGAVVDSISGFSFDGPWPDYGMYLSRIDGSIIIPAGTDLAIESGIYTGVHLDKYDSEGSLTWTQTIEDIESGANNMMVAENSNGKIFFTYDWNRGGPSPNHGGAIRRYSSTGSLEEDIAYAPGAGGTARIYSSVATYPGSTDVFHLRAHEADNDTCDLIRYDEDLDEVWSVEVADTYGYQLSVDDDGTIYTIAFSDWILRSYDPSDGSAIEEWDFTAIFESAPDHESSEPFFASFIVRDGVFYSSWGFWEETDEFFGIFRGAMVAYDLDSETILWTTESVLDQSLPGIGAS